MAWFFRSPSRPQSDKPIRRRRAGIESLEPRCYLSSVPLAVPCALPPPPRPPVIDSFEIEVVWRTTVNVVGHISDDKPLQVALNFSGALTGSTTPDIQGNFRFTTTAEELGTITVTAVDPVFGSSDTENVELQSNAPAIQEFSATVVQDHYLVVEGTVVDEDREGLTVQITLFNQLYSAETDWLGRFLWYYQLQPEDYGTLSVMTEDWWGLDSNICQDLIQYA